MLVNKIFYGVVVKIDPANEFKMPMKKTPTHKVLDFCSTFVNCKIAKEIYDFRKDILGIQMLAMDFASF
jgi:hypothetical protein